MGEHHGPRQWPGRSFEGHGGWGAGPGRGGPPPWLAGMFGAGGPGQGRGPGRGPRARRGDVRAAILDVLQAGSLNGYQIIQQITERTGGAWKPSPGSVYPTIQQLQDEDLVETDEASKGKQLKLTQAGRDYVAAHPEELAAVWRPFVDDSQASDSFESTLKPELKKLGGAVWQLVVAGTEEQQRAAVDVLVEARRKLYGILADESES